MKFTHLHTHSHYSLLDGLPKIGELLDYTKELGMNSLALTDHGNMYGAVEFFIEAKKRGIKPIIGVEAYVALKKYNDFKNITNNNKRDYRHLIILVKNKKGYQNLVKLVTESYLRGFYYRPRIDEELLERYSEGLIITSACLAGKIPQLILSKQFKEAEETILKYQVIFKDDFYLELQYHPNFPEQKVVNKKLIEYSKKFGVKIIATNDIHYLRKEDNEVQDILIAINTGHQVDDINRMTMKDFDLSMLSPKEMIENFKDLPEAINNTQEIVKKCNFEFELGKFKIPSFPIPENKNADQYLKELAYQNIEKRYPNENNQKIKEIKERIDYELSVISDSNFSSYFLIVQDFVDWSKKNKIVVGPGRGSAAGCLISYLIGVTNIDPLKYGLIFERFLNPGRKDSPPDIDLDFADHRRDEVFNYISEKYGQEKVAQIITFGTIAARAGIRDVGRVLNYPYSYCDRLAKIIPMGFTLDKTLNEIKEFKKIYETDSEAKKLIDLAKKLEGVIRHASTHACGLIISDQPLEEIVPTQKSSIDENIIISQYDMYSVEQVGLLKMDLLGLKTLTIIEKTLKTIEKRYDIDLDIEKIALDDKKSFKLLEEGKTISVFQLESSGMRRYLKEMKPDQFENIIAQVALYRPGPIQLFPSYIARKQGKEKITYLDLRLKPILEETYGLLIYQEQIMKIAQKLAGFTLAEADTLRKAIGKKIKDLLDSQKEKFISGIIANGATKQTGIKIWEWILPFASYGFNKSHATGYALIAYQTAYLKAHYPTEFMASVLNSEKDTEKFSFLIDECKNLGVNVLPPEINESKAFFTAVDNGKIRFGMSAIKNVGQGIVDIIIDERKKNGAFKSFFDFLSRVKNKDLNKRSLESLIKAGVFDNLEKREKLLYNMEYILSFIKELKQHNNGNQVSLFASLPTQSLNSIELKLEEAKKISEIEKLGYEKELLGIYVSKHPLDFYKKILTKTFPISKISKNNVNNKIEIGGIVSAVKKVLTKTGQEMFFIKIEDLTGSIEVIIFPKIAITSPRFFERGKILFIYGKIDNKDGEIKVLAEKVEEITN